MKEEQTMDMIYLLVEEDENSLSEEDEDIISSSKEEIENDE